VNSLKINHFFIHIYQTALAACVSSIDFAETWSLLAACVSSIDFAETWSLLTAYSVITVVSCSILIVFVVVVIN